MRAEGGKTGQLAIAKLANVGLAMLWGFAVTFVFVRLLPLEDFRAFLVLVAFANFTISAEFGFSTVIYSRVRRFVLDRSGLFRTEELGVVFLFLVGVIAIGAVAIVLALISGWIATSRPELFLGFYVLSALNLIAALCRKLLAAIDANLMWEGLDFFRRVSGLALLGCALAGLSIELSIALQIVTTLAVFLIAMVHAQRILAMPWHHWFAVRVGGGHVRKHYLGDLRDTVLLTVGEAGAYNAPYITIAAMTPDPRPVLMFDFLFKLGRAVTALSRAIVETLLPGYTAAHYDQSDAPRRLRNMLLLCLGMSGCAAIAVIVAGPWFSAILFDGHYVASRAESVAIGIVLLMLAILCTSVYVQSALGRFARLRPAAALFLAGSIACAPLATLVGGDFSTGFAFLHAGLFILVALVHWRSLEDLR